MGDSHWLAHALYVFVITETMPAGMQMLAKTQSLTHVIDAIRGLLVGTPVGNHVWVSVVWSLSLLVVGFTACVMIFRRQAK